MSTATRTSARCSVRSTRSSRPQERSSRRACATTSSPCPEGGSTLDAARLFGDPEVGPGETGRPLFDALLTAEGEEAVIAALHSAGYWDDESSWAVLGDEENNFSVASNQQTDPTTALVEKVINSVDAMLMAGAYKAGVDPQG